MQNQIAPETKLGFLVTEIGSGLTFANLALTARPSDHDKIQRNTKNARVAYNSVLRFRKTVQLDEVQNEKLEAAIEKLREVLRRLGEAV